MDKKTIDYILKVLRKGTITWSGRSDCLKRSRKKVLTGRTATGKAKYKLHWQCEKCLEWTDKGGDMEVDHIEEVGPFTGSWEDLINRMYCGPENLQALCVPCHLKKTTHFNASLRFKRKEK